MARENGKEREGSGSWGGDEGRVGGWSGSEAELGKGEGGRWGSGGICRREKGESKEGR